ncbi:MAG: RecQ family ATP-dependent DNA helicase [Pirellula sp.]|jgi:ATP-dependent DNA helicase RecQ|nr:RecQ family ATP-dependent DNA helicase [Pirellula sp.]
MSTTATPDLQNALAKFGLAEFRRGQREVIDHILAGNDCLCVMPTGGGKSLCYQLPSVVRTGLTIVVSPLIALMKDQVDALTRRGIAATLINSTLSPAEQNQRLDRVARGKYSLLYVAPERLRNQNFVDAIRSTPIQLLAIDEAHCISEWGHDFRPDYQRVGRFREALGGVQTVALTATATPRVRQDIVDSLRLKVAKHFITGFARDNLYFGVVQCRSDRDKEQKLVEFLQTKPGSGIIYAATRKRCEALVELLAKEAKISVGVYHAGLAPDQRKFIQEQFMRGELEAIVATNAFGMGIDKSDLRYVVHFNTPGTIEAYYQEAGRAGRDGLPSQCVLLYSPQDRYIQEFFIENANPSKEIIESVYKFLISYPTDPIELTAEEIKERTNAPVSSEAINSCLQLLSRTEVVERLEVAGGLAMVRIDSKLPTLVDLLPKEATVKRSVLRVVEKAVGDRREEAVYVNPRWLMQQLQMERDALSRHLRELCNLPGFDYVPPFRGRAIHIRKRDVPFDKLGIDHKTLAERKKADYEKLDRMVAYSQTRSCRQKNILEYFGDGSASDCKLCDRCHGKTGWVPLPELPLDVQLKLQAKQKQNNATVLADNTQTSDAVAATPTSATPTAPTQKAAAQPSVEKKSSTSSSKTKQAAKGDAVNLLPAEQERARAVANQVLSAIDRTHGYLSKTVLSQFFAGTDNKAIQGLRLSRLNEFGMLQDWKRTHVSALLDLMLDTTLLLLTELRQGKVTVSVGPIGLACMSGSQAYPDSVIGFIHKSSLASSHSQETITTPTKQEADSVHPPHKETVSKSTSPDLNHAEESQRGSPKPSSPANQSMAGIAAPANSTAPTNTNEATDAINAIDAVYTPDAPDAPDVAEDQLQEWSEIRTPEKLTAPHKSDANAIRDPMSPTTEDWHWSARLAQHGYRLGEIALIRGKQPDQVLDDLCKALDYKIKIPIEQLFDRRTQIAMRELQTSGPLSGAAPTAFSSFPRLWEFAKRWANS